MLLQPNADLKGPGLNRAVTCVHLLLLKFVYSIMGNKFCVVKHNVVMIFDYFLKRTEINSSILATEPFFTEFPT